MSLGTIVVQGRSVFLLKKSLLDDFLCMMVGLDKKLLLISMKDV